MMKLAGVAVAAVMACGCLGAGGAEAQTIYVRYDGLAAVDDGFGVFGPPGRVVNAPISIVYAVDSDSSFNMFLPDTPTSQQRFSPFAEFSIRRQTFTLDNNDFGYLLYSVKNVSDGMTSSSTGIAGTDGDFNVVNMQGAGTSTDAELITTVEISSPAIPRDLFKPYSYTLRSGDVGFGYLAVAFGNLSDPNCDYDSGITCYGNFGITYSISRVSASYTMPSLVPLPASAPLFGAALLGLAGLGYGLRNRNRINA